MSEDTEAPPAEDTDSQEASPSPSAPDAKKGGIFLGGIALVVIYGASFAVAYFVPAGHAANPHSADAATGVEVGEDGEPLAESDPKKASGSWDRALFDIPTLVVNLMGTGGKRYAKVGITLEFAARDAKVTAESVKERLIPLRDRLLSRISSETLETVDDPERRERLRMDILAAVREVCFHDLEDASVLRIYYREFIVQ